MSRRRKAPEAQLPAVPFAILKIYSFGSPEVCVVALEVGDGYFVLEHLVGPGHIGVFALKKSAIGGFQYHLADAEVAQAAKDLKSKALEKGATLEAIQLLGALMPLTIEEELTMAEAGTKLSRKSADKEGLKKAAKDAPVEKKSRGNPEALAKARAARAEAPKGPDTRKIVVLKKDHGARSGTKRAALLDKIFKAKNVQAAVDSGVSRSDIAWAAREEYISVG